jgi:hypothetical protein
MDLESGISNIAYDFTLLYQFDKLADPFLSGLHLMTETTKEGTMEIKVSHSIDQNKISLSLLNLKSS